VISGARLVITEKALAGLLLVSVACIPILITSYLFIRGLVQEARHCSASHHAQPGNRNRYPCCATFAVFNAVIFNPPSTYVLGPQGEARTLARLTRRPPGLVYRPPLRFRWVCALITEKALAGAQACILTLQLYPERDAPVWAQSIYFTRFRLSPTGTLWTPTEYHGVRQSSESQRKKKWPKRDTLQFARQPQRRTQARKGERREGHTTQKLPAMSSPKKCF